MADDELDAYQQKSELYKKYSKDWNVRQDLAVRANGTDRSVTLRVGYIEDSPKFLGSGNTPKGKDGRAIITRNVITMRELAQAILDACDFVDGVNPKWAQGHAKPEEFQKQVDHEHQWQDTGFATVEDCAVDGCRWTRSNGTIFPPSNPSLASTPVCPTCGGSGRYGDDTATCFACGGAGR